MLRSSCCASGANLLLGNCTSSCRHSSSARMGVHGVAVRLFHLPVMDHADLFLRLGGLFHGRIEQDEVLVLGFGLREPVGAALAIPAIGDGEFRLSQVFTGVVGVDQRLQRQPCHLIAAALDILDSFVEQNLVGLLRVFARSGSRSCACGTRRRAAIRPPRPAPARNEHSCFSMITHLRDHSPQRQHAPYRLPRQCAAYRRTV